MSHWTDHLDPRQPDGAFLSWKQVQPRVGISRTTAWRLQKAGDFPRPYLISAGRVAYREREVEAWRASRAHRARERDGEGAPTPSPPPSRPGTAASRAATCPAAPQPGPRSRRRPPAAAEQITFEF